MKFYNRGNMTRGFSNISNSQIYLANQKNKNIINNNSKYNNSQTIKNPSDFELFEKKVNLEFNGIKQQMREIKEMKETKERDEINNINIKLDYVLTKMKYFDTIINTVKSLEKRINKLSEEIKNKFNESTNNNKKEKIITKEKKYVIDSNEVNNIKEKNIKDFITLYKKEELGFKYFEPYEIEDENKIIADKIKNSVFEYYLPENEDCENELSGKFLYSVGGISRISQNLANYIYLDLFNEYKIYLEENNEWLTFNHEEDRKNLSIWVKKCLNEKQFFEYYSNINIYKIKKYLYTKDEKTNKILLELFKDFINLYTKCLLSYPLVEVKYTSNNCKFENSIMLDIIYKGKNKLVNFCYLPGLMSNGQLIKGGKFYVFTFLKDKSYQKKEDLFDDEIAVQQAILYSIPNNQSLQITFDKNFDIRNKIFKIKTLTNPKIPSELKPNYRLMKKNNNKYEKISENKSGNFLIEEKYLFGYFYVSINYCLRNTKNSRIFKIDEKTMNIVMIY